jgi:alcohol dehydrogenase class IV
VTDAGVASLPITDTTLSLCRAAGLNISVFSEVKPNPVGANVEAGITAIRAGQHDGVIAFGGGSALDVAKTLALMAGQTRPVWDFEDIGDNWTRADAAAILPIVAVPTTSGTGSEVGRCSVIVDESDHRKVVLFHPQMMPGRVLCDPELTLGLPAHITAGVGMDALAHNLEAYCAPGFHPQADGIALEGIRLVDSALIQATRDGSDIAARSAMMASALMGATAFQKGLGAIHSLSHPVGAHYDSHHGLTNAVFMPYVLIANRRAIEDRLGRLAAYLGLPEASFDGFLKWNLALREALDIPHSPAALGMKEEDVPSFAREAAIDPTAATNPIPVDVPTLERIYRKALAGDLGT